MSYIERSRPDAVRAIPKRTDYIEEAILGGEKPYFYLDKGVPSQPSAALWKRYYEIKNSPEFDKLTEYPHEQVEQGKQGFRNIFGLDKDHKYSPHIFFSNGGSDEIIERKMRLYHLPPKSTIIIGSGSQFSDIAGFAQTYDSGQNGGISYRNTEPDLQLSLNDMLEEAKAKRKKEMRSNRRSYYICNFSTPTGDVADPEVVKDFAEFMAKQKILVTVDEAYSSTRKLKDSAAHLTQVLPNMIVLRSDFSKGMGFPGMRIGEAAMSKEIGEEYEKLRRHFDLPTQTQLYINGLMDKALIEPHYESERQRVIKLKRALTNAFADEDIDILPTAPDSALLTVDGGAGTFHKNLTTSFGVATSPGAGYRNTDRRFIANRFARLVLNDQIQISDTPEIAHRIKKAMLMSHDKL